MNEVTLAVISAVAGGAGIFGAIQAITLVSARARLNAAIASLIAAREASAGEVVKRTVQHAIDRQALVLSSIYLFPLRPRLTILLGIGAAFVGGCLLYPAVLHFSGLMQSVEPKEAAGFSLLLGTIGGVLTEIAWLLSVSISRIEFLDTQLKKIDYMNYSPPEYQGINAADSS